MKHVCREILEWSFLFLQACFCVLAVLTCLIWLPLMMYAGPPEEPSQPYDRYRCGLQAKLKGRMLSVGKDAAHTYQWRINGLYAAYFDLNFNCHPSAPACQGQGPKRVFVDCPRADTAC
jgi:hypothetical protein